MQQTMVTLLRETWPGMEVMIASPFPSIDRSYYRDAVVLKCYRRNLPLAVIQLIVLLLLRLTGLSPRICPVSREVEAMIDSDMVIDLSGDMLTEDYGPLVCLSHFLPLLQAQILKRPNIICAQSIGPFRRLTRLATRVLSRADMVTVREGISEKYVKALSPCSPLVRTADIAFLMKSSPPNRAREILELEVVPEPDGELRLGVSLSALLINNINRHIRNDAGTDSVAEISRALDRVSSELNVQILFLPHVFGPRSGADDRSAIQAVMKLMNTRPASIKNEYRAEELKAIIATCDAFLGSRMHANIAALDSLIPVLAIGYSHKTEGILRELDLQQWVLSNADMTADGLFSALVRLLHDLSDYRAHLQDRLPAVRERAWKNIDIIKHIVEPERTHPVQGEV